MKKMTTRSYVVSLLILLAMLGATSFALHKEFNGFKARVVAVVHTLQDMTGVSGSTRNNINAITVAQLKKIAPGANPKILKSLASLSRTTIKHCKLNTRNRVAFFYSVAAKESWGFTKMVEKTDTKRFARYDRMRVKLGNLVSGDGKRYRGRGIIQLTGRRNYRVVGNKIGVDLINKPWLAADPIISVRTACVFWTTNRVVRNRRTKRKYIVNINEFVDRNNLGMVTKLVTGSSRQQIRDRKIYLNRAKLAFKNWKMPPVAGWDNKYNAEDYDLDDQDEPFGKEEIKTLQTSL